MIVVAARKKAKRISLKLGASKAGKKPRPGKGDWSPTRFMRSVVVIGASALLVVGLFAGVVVGFVLLGRYVKDTVAPSHNPATIHLVDVPEWVNEPLKERIYAAARADANDLRVHEDAARSVQRNVERLVPWLHEVEVQAAHDGIYIKGKWRKPLALVELGLRRFYVDAGLLVLDVVPMPNLPITKVKGLSAVPRLPAPGDRWQRDDLAAAVDILSRLDQMDRSLTPDKPLLYEIDRIDVSNFKGRQNTRLPHIVLYARDNTEIIWGAEIGAWQRHLEATDREKLAKLYGYYKEYGSLSGGVKYINLRDPQGRIPLPVDRY